MNHNSLMCCLGKGLRLLFAVALVAGMTLVPAPVRVAHAAGFTVNTTADTVDASPGDGFCADANGQCSLRAAIQETNALAGADRIDLPGGSLYRLTIAGPGEDNAATGDLDIRGDLTLAGEGPVSTVIDGNALDRVFEVHAGVRVEFRALSIRNGSASEGGGIFVGGDVNSPASTVSIFDSIISSNRATGDGGGISSNSHSTITIRRSTLVGNTAGGDGGGVRHGRPFNVGGGALRVDDSTISGNTAGGFGGGIDGTNRSLVELESSTLAFNTARYGGSLATFAGSSSTAKNTIFANSTASGECSPRLGLSQGHNLASDGSCALSEPSDLSDADPLLGPLLINRGLTPTHAPSPGSPAIDAGVCSVPLSTHDFDQRMIIRPFDGDGDKLAVCDIGAFEAPSVPLDDFANAAHPGGRLGDRWDGAKSLHRYRVVNDQLDVEGGGPVFWAGDVFGAEQQAFVTLAKVDPLGQYHGLLLKMQGTSWRQGVISVFYDATAQEIGIETFVPGLGWLTELTIPNKVLNDGDQLGARTHGGELDVFLNGDLIREVPVHPFFQGKGGRVGLWFVVAADAVLDDFSAATVAP